MQPHLSIATSALLLIAFTTPVTSNALPECQIQEEGEIPIVGGTYQAIDDLICVRLNTVIAGPLIPNMNETDPIAHAGIVILTMQGAGVPVFGVGTSSPCDAFFLFDCEVFSSTPLGTPEFVIPNTVCIHDADYRISATEDGPRITYTAMAIGPCPLPI